MGLDNCKKNAPQRCSISGDLPTSEVQKDGQTSLLEETKSSYGTQSTGNALYHGAKDVDRFYSKTEILFEKANEMFYQIDKYKNREIYDFSRYSLSLYDLVKIQQALVNSCQQELSMQKDKYELLQKQFNDFTESVYSRGINQKIAESKDDDEVTHGNAIQEIDQTPHREKMIIKDDGRIAIPSTESSKELPKPSALTAYLTKVATASRKGRKPKKPILLMSTSEEGWTKAVARYGGPNMETEVNLMGNKMDVVDDNRYTPLMPEWISDTNNSEESSDDSFNKSFPLAFLGNAKRQQGPKSPNIINYPQSSTGEVLSTKESKRSITESNQLDTKSCSPVATITDDLQGSNIIIHGKTDFVKESIRSPVVTSVEVLTPRSIPLQETGKKVALSKGKEPKLLIKKNSSLTGMSKNSTKILRSTTKGSTVVCKQSSTSVKKLPNESDVKKAELKKDKATRMKSINNKRTVSKNSVEKWTAKLSREEIFKRMFGGKKPVECKYRLVVMEGVTTGEGHVNAALWSAGLEVKESDIPYIKEVGGKTVLLVRYEAILKVVDGLCRNAVGSKVVTDETSLRQYLTHNKSTLVSHLSNTKRIWKSFVPLQKSIKVVVKDLNSIETVTLTTITLNTKAIKDIRSQYEHC